MALDYAKIRRAGGCSGIAAVIVYLLATFIAAARYPVRFSPLTNWISDMGSYGLDPSGAIIYNVGAAVAALLLVPFFLSFMLWYGRDRGDKRPYIAIGLLGLAAVLFMVLHAIFTEDSLPSHVLVAGGCFLTLALILLLANWTFLKGRELNRLIACYGLAAGAVGVIFFIVITLYYLFFVTGNPPFLFEWVTVYASFLWLTLVSFSMLTG